MALQTLYWIFDDENKRAIGGASEGSGLITYAGDVPSWLLSELVRREPHLGASLAVPPALPAPLPPIVEDSIDYFITDGEDGVLGSLFTAAAPFSGSDADVAAMATKVAEHGTDLCTWGSHASLTRNTLHLYGHSRDGDMMFIITRAASLADARRILSQLNKAAVRQIGFMKEE